VWALGGLFFLLGRTTGELGLLSRDLIWTKLRDAADGTLDSIGAHLLRFDLLIEQLGEIRYDSDPLSY
jgi:hypothetical protein